MKKALEELVKAIKDLVISKASSSPLVMCTMLTSHRGYNRKRRSASKEPYSCFGHSSSNPSRAGLEAICQILSVLAVIQWIQSLLIAMSFILPQLQHS